MGKSNKMSVGTGSIIGTLVVFLVVGTTCAIIGFYNKIYNWLFKFGLAFLFLSLPLLLFLLYKLTMGKIKRM